MQDETRMPAGRAQRNARDREIADALELLAGATETLALTAPGGTSPGAGGAAGPAALDLARVADDSIARALGASAGGDPRRLLARLEAVFPAREENGSTTYAYRPVGTQPVEGASGALVAGAQAALYQQARVLGASIRGLLDGLVPLVTDPDEEDISSLIATYRETIDTIVEEFGREGGAVLSRIRVGAQLLQRIAEQLGEKLGLRGTDADDRREMALLERDALVENVAMLEALSQQLVEDLVESYRNKVLDGVSTRFARLAWSVRALPASVAQVRGEFDALRIGEADRRLMALDGDGSLDAELTLQWCEGAAAQWLQRLAAGRRIDIRVVKEEAEALYGALPSLQGDLKRVPGSARLLAAMRELLRQLDTLAEFARLILGEAAAARQGAAAD